jgi:hypothetical protein
MGVKHEKKRSVKQRTALPSCPPGSLEVQESPSAHALPLQLSYESAEPLSSKCPLDTGKEGRETLLLTARSKRAVAVD